MVDKAKDNPYLNSWLFNPFKVSDFPGVKGLASEIYEEFLKEEIYERDASSNKKQKRRTHIQTVILNLFAAYCEDQSRYIAYSKDHKRYYRQDSRYNRIFLSHKILLRTIDGFDQLGYITNVPGWYDRKSKKGYISRMIATNKLIDRIEAHHIKREHIRQGVEYEEFIILREKKKKKSEKPKNIEYDNTSETDRFHKNIDQINDALSQAFIGLYVPDYEIQLINKQLRQKPDKFPINFDRKLIYRIFNNGCFDLGGRFYGGWWQNIPSEYRKFIRIAYSSDYDVPRSTILDESVVELDYSAHHARMLYSWMGLHYNQRPYVFGKFDPFWFPEYDYSMRSIFKMAFYTILNADDRDEAIYVIQEEMKGKPLDLKIKNASDVVEVIEKNHPLIKECFFQGVGLELQYEDSMVAEKVMLEMLKHGCIALTMHDSFIVPAKFENTLKQVMEQAFIDVTHIECETDKKETRDEWFEEIKRKSTPEQVHRYENASYFHYQARLNLWRKGTDIQEAA